VPSRPSVSASARAPGPPGASLDLGRALSLEDIAAEAAFIVLLPESLGPPDAAYLGGAPLRGQVAFVYAPRGDLPPSALLEGAGLLITQNRGAPDEGLAHKIVGTTGATVEPVQVNGARGVWISGAPHMFWYLAPDGSVISDSRRLVGNTLAWERDGILYRIEGDIPLSEALDIARSMR
jgi:hypothetical protein